MEFGAPTRVCTFYATRRERVKFFFYGLTIFVERVSKVGRLLWSARDSKNLALS